MKKKAQIENLIYFIVVILLFFSAIFYYLKFKTGNVPVFNPKREIVPSEKGVLPPGTFFEKENKNKKNKLLPLLFINQVYAKDDLKPDKNLETLILSPNSFTILEDNKLYIVVEGYDKNDSKEKIYFQYKLEPLINEWKNLYQKRKLIILPKGNYLYNLKVRAVNKKGYDPTPAVSYIYTPISSYYKDVEIYINSSKDLIIIKNLSNNDINISGWKIKSSLINFTIPQAVKNVDLFSTKTLEDIVLKRKKGRLFIHKVELPFNFNFLANKCFIYLNQNFPDVYKFVKKNTFFKCQKLKRETLFGLKNQLNNQCLEVLEKISCEGPKTKDWIKIENNSSCFKFFDENFTYNGCYKNKINEEDFYTNDWYVYFDPGYKFTKNRYDEIILYDKNGLIVNKKTIY
jgi:hypothetical protein